MKMNTRCFVINDDHIGKHDLQEVGPRSPVHGKISPFVGDGYPSEPVKILYKVKFRCSRCGDGGLFDQDGNAIEYYQPTTIRT